MQDGFQAGMVWTIGNFDGVHLGHQALIARAAGLAHSLGSGLGVLTFDPHPRQFFKPSDPPFTLMGTPSRIRELKAAGAACVWVEAFDAAMAGRSAQAFINEILWDTLKARHIVVGEDFHFGKDRAGRAATIAADGRLGVTTIPLITDDLAPVSSTRIRQALKSGDMSGAKAMLGRWWEIEGPVLHGDQRGRTLGYPTANMALGGVIAAAYGIYAVQVWLGGQWRSGVANLGIRPMFEVSAPLLEVHIFDFEGDLYDQVLRVRVMGKLRDEARFDTLNALTAQMDKDAAAARLLLADIA